jgi:hypothetical protein
MRTKSVWERGGFLVISDSNSVTQLDDLLYIGTTVRISGAVLWKMAKLKTLASSPIEKMS